MHQSTGTDRLRRPGARRPLAALAADRRGATIIEFALCSSMFFALLLGAAQVALIYFAQQGIQTTAEKIARQVMTGEIRSSTTSKSNFKQAACNALPSYMTCAKLYVDVRTATNFESLDTNAVSLTPDAGGSIDNNFSYDAGGPGSIVILRLYYAWRVVGGPLNMSLTNNGPDRMLIGTMVFKSEVYQ